MVLLALHLPATTVVPVICLRQSSTGESIAQSIVIEMLVPAINASAEMPEYINGWERNPKQAVDLNLKLTELFGHNEDWVDDAAKIKSLGTCAICLLVMFPAQLFNY